MVGRKSGVLTEDRDTHLKERGVGVFIPLVRAVEQMVLAV